MLAVADAANTTQDARASNVFNGGARSDRDVGLLVVHSPDAEQVGRVVRVTRQISLGREGVDLTIADPALSRRHATISRTSGLSIEDHASRNGTFVEGRRIEKAMLAPGMLARVGETLLLAGRFTADEPYATRDPELIHYSGELSRALDTVDRAAPTSAPVLVLGESGTGKELLARRVHERSGRRGAFVALNCGAIPEGLAEATLFGHRRGAFTGAVQDAAGAFASAEGGTLFFDEIGELPLDLQPKLLRALESGEVAPVGATKARVVDARIVAATNADLEAEVVAGSFRADLYARLKGFVVQAPPLRARRADIPLLLRHFLDKERPDASVEMSASFLESLLLYRWPLNVRELKMSVHRLLANAGGSSVLRSIHLQGAIDAAVSRETARRSGASDGDAPAEGELRAALERYAGNVAQVAQFFAKHRKQVYRWLEKYELDPTSFRR